MVAETWQFQTETDTHQKCRIFIRNCMATTVTVSNETCNRTGQSVCLTSFPPNFLNYRISSYWLAPFSSPSPLLQLQDRYWTIAYSHSTAPCFMTVSSWCVTYILYHIFMHSEDGKRSVWLNSKRQIHAILSITWNSNNVLVFQLCQILLR